MNLIICPIYTYFITQRESCIELIFCTDRLYFERKYTKNFSWPNACLESVLITDEFLLGHLFYHFSRVMFPVHIQYRYTVSRA